MIRISYMLFLSVQAPYLVYVEVLECENACTAPVPSKLLESTRRFTRSEENIYVVNRSLADRSPRPELIMAYSASIAEFDDSDCWTQEDDDIIQVYICEGGGWGKGGKARDTLRDTEPYIIISYLKLTLKLA